MKRLFLYAILSLATSACLKQEYPLFFELTNTVDRFREDAPMVINRQLLPQSDSTLLPIVFLEDKRMCPSQIDDLNGDGVWDELAFVTNFEPLERITVNIHWVHPEHYPEFPRKTNIRLAKQLSVESSVVELKNDVHGKDLSLIYDQTPYQMEGIGWENDKVAFRHTLNGRNARDLFGKKTSEMVLDSVGIMSNGQVSDTYHQMAGWGMDLLRVAESSGLGGLSVLVNNQHTRLGSGQGKRIDNVDTTQVEIITEGPVRSIFRLDFKGWQIPSGKIDLTEVVTIWRSQHGYENTIYCSNLSKDARLISGIPTNDLNKQPWLRKYEFGMVALATHGLQSANNEYYLGLALIVPTSYFDGTFYSDEITHNEIVGQWSAKLKPQNGVLRYWVYGAWELENPGFKSADYFDRFLDFEALYLKNPIQVTVASKPNQREK